MTRSYVGRTMTVADLAAALVKHHRVTVGDRPSASTYVVHWVSPRVAEHGAASGADPETWTREYATVVVHDGLGLLAIESSFGSWVHAWHPAHIGAPSLHHFLARTDWHYVLTKCMGAREMRCPDPEATRNELHAWVIRDRRSGHLDRDEARERYDDVTLWYDDNVALEAPTVPDWLDEPWDHIVWRYTGEVIVFRDQVWPAVQYALRRVVDRRESNAARARMLEMSGRSRPDGGPPLTPKARMAIYLMACVEEERLAWNGETQR